MKQDPFEKAVLAAVLLAGFVLSPKALAECNFNKFYVDADAGVNLAGDIKPKSTGLSLSTDPGMRLSIGAGYTFRLMDKVGLGLSAETGFMYNGLDKISGPGGAASLSGEYFQVPFLVNAILSYQITDKLSLYGGFGGGGVYGDIHYSKSNINSSETDGAYQAQGGVRYAITDRSEIGLSYKYLGVMVKDANTVGNHSIGASYTLHF